MIQANKGRIILGGTSETLMGELTCIIASLRERKDIPEFYIRMAMARGMLVNSDKHNSIEIDLEELKKQMKGDEENGHI